MYRKSDKGYVHILPYERQCFLASVLSKAKTNQLYPFSTYSLTIVTQIHLIYDLVLVFMTLDLSLDLVSYHLNPNTMATALMCLLSFHNHIWKFHKCLPCPSNFTQMKTSFSTKWYMCAEDEDGASDPSSSMSKQIRNNRKLNLHKVIHLYTISILTKASKLMLATYWESITWLAEC